MIRQARQPRMNTGHRIQRISSSARTSILMIKAEPSILSDRGWATEKGLKEKSKLTVAALSTKKRIPG